MQTETLEDTFQKRKGMVEANTGIKITAGGFFNIMSP